MLDAVLVQMALTDDWHGKIVCQAFTRAGQHRTNDGHYDLSQSFSVVWVSSYCMLRTVKKIAGAL